MTRTKTHPIFITNNSIYSLATQNPATFTEIDVTLPITIDGKHFKHFLRFFNIFRM